MHHVNMSLADVIGDLEDISTDLTDIRDYLDNCTDFVLGTDKEDVLTAQNLINKVIKNLRIEAK